MLKKIIFWTSLLYSFFYFLGSFLPSWILIRIRNLYADPDPDPAAQINADPDPDTDPDPKPWSGEQETRKLQRGAGIIPFKNNKFLFSVFF